MTDWLFYFIWTLHRSHRIQTYFCIQPWFYLSASRHRESQNKLKISAYISSSECIKLSFPFSIHASYFYRSCNIHKETSRVTCCSDVTRTDYQQLENIKFNWCNHNIFNSEITICLSLCKLLKLSLFCFHLGVEAAYRELPISSLDFSQE